MEQNKEEKSKVANPLTTMDKGTKPGISPIDKAISTFTEHREKAQDIKSMLFLDATLAVLTTIKDEGDGYYTSLKEQRDEMLRACDELVDTFGSAEIPVYYQRAIDDFQDTIAKAKGGING